MQSTTPTVILYGRVFTFHISGRHNTYRLFSSRTLKLPLGITGSKADSWVLR